MFKKHMWNKESEQSKKLANKRGVNVLERVEECSEMVQACGKTG